MSTRSGPEEAFAEAVAIMARLRGPGGCPWDREQTFESIRKYTLEESYEVLDAIERRDWAHLQEELGDLLLQVLFYAQMAADEDHFSIADVVEGLNRKLVRRHPHVFGEAASAAAGNAAASAMAIQGIDAKQVLRNWDEIKAAEKGASTGEAGAAPSRLGSIPRSLPALMEAAKLGSKAAKSGFDWPDTEGVFLKLEEETAELKAAIADPDAAPQIADELGDMLFTIVNLARHLGVDPELALRETNAKFRRRFDRMEKSSVDPLESVSPPELEELWSRAKLAEVSAE